MHGYFLVEKNRKAETESKIVGMALYFSFGSIYSKCQGINNCCDNLLVLQQCISKDVFGCVLHHTVTVGLAQMGVVYTVIWIMRNDTRIKKAETRRHEHVRMETPVSFEWDLQFELIATERICADLILHPGTSQSDSLWLDIFNCCIRRLSKCIFPGVYDECCFTTQHVNSKYLIYVLSGCFL